MQIVIDIPDLLYVFSNSDMTRETMESYFNIVRSAIIHGVVLPKNHGRLIDATDLLEICEFKETEREVSGAQTVVPGAWEWGKESKDEIQGRRQG